MTPTQQRRFLTNHDYFNLVSYFPFLENDQLQKILAILAALHRQEALPVLPRRLAHECIRRGYASAAMSIWPDLGINARDPGHNLVRYAVAQPDDTLIDWLKNRLNPAEQRELLTEQRGRSLPYADTGHNYCAANVDAAANVDNVAALDRLVRWYQEVGGEAFAHNMLTSPKALRALFWANPAAISSEFWAAYSRQVGKWTPQMFASFTDSFPE